MVNSMQARLRAQLGDKTEYSGERRRRAVVVASIVLTITDPLRGSYPLLCNLQAALIRSCGASFACMELTIISRFQRPQASTKSLLHSLFYSFSVLSKYRVPTMQNRSGDWYNSFQGIILFSGVFRRETASGFYPWAMWKTLARGWRRDCAVGGMETRFQWRKAHSHTAKCEAFHALLQGCFLCFCFWFHSQFGNKA